MALNDVLIKTDRLLVRSWRQDDTDDLVMMNANTEVMRHFPSVLDRNQSLDFVKRLQCHDQENGFSMWPVIDCDQNFVGMCGLYRVGFDAPFTPAVEVGWRFLPQYWGKGFAYEAASAVLTYGFEALKLPHIVSFTSETNIRSWRLMERLGMGRGEDFIHPLLEPEHELALHRLYSISKPV